MLSGALSKASTARHTQLDVREPASTAQKSYREMRSFRPSMLCRRRASRFFSIGSVSVSSGMRLTSRLIERRLSRLVAPESEALESALSFRLSLCSAGNPTRDPVLKPMLKPPVLNISDSRRGRFSSGLDAPASEALDSALSARLSLSPAGDPVLDPMLNISDSRRWRGRDAPESEALESTLSARLSRSPGAPVLNISESRRSRPRMRPATASATANELRRVLLSSSEFLLGKPSEPRLAAAASASAAVEAAARRMSDSLRSAPMSFSSEVEERRRSRTAGLLTAPAALLLLLLTLCQLDVPPLVAVSLSLLVLPPRCRPSGKDSSNVAMRWRTSWR